MTRLEHALELAGDIRDCASRLKDLGFPGFSEDLYHAANETERMARKGERPGLVLAPERDSLPPLHEANQPKRTAATEAFRKARALLKGLT